MPQLQLKASNPKDRLRNQIWAAMRSPEAMAEFTKLSGGEPYADTPLGPMGSVGAMVLNPKTIGKFKQAFFANIPETAKAYPHLTDDTIEALSFINTRYPSFLARANPRAINNLITPGSKGRYYPQVDHVTINPSDSVANTIKTSFGDVQDRTGALLHELRHAVQFKDPRFPRGIKQLGPYPAERVLAEGTNKNIPHEIEAYKAEELGKKAKELYFKLLKSFK